MLKLIVAAARQDIFDGASAGHAISDDDEILFHLH